MDNTHRGHDGLPIQPDRIYVVTPTGEPDFSWGLDVVFVQPAHLWRAEYRPERAALVRLVRADNTSRMSYWIAAPGLIGVRVHAMHGRFRLVPHRELLAAADAIVAQMSRSIPGTDVVVEIPRGFNIDIVPPHLVYGTLAAHGEALLARVAAAAAGPDVGST